MLPFTVEQFSDVFAAYNVAVWPIQVILVLLAAAAVLLALKPRPFSDRMIALLLAILWLWMGAAYHLAFFSRINRAAYAFAVLCIVQAVIFLVAGVTPQNLAFRTRTNAMGIVGGLFVVYSLFAYPVIGYVLGRTYTRSPTFGAPCPTTIFTFGMLLWADGIIHRYMLAIPLGWSLIGIIAALELGMVEDIALPVVGVLSTALILLRNSRLKEAMLREAGDALRCAAGRPVTMPPESLADPLARGNAR
jgi:hypothetical protein